MTDVRSDAGGESKGYVPPMTAREVVDLTHPDWNTEWASIEAINRYRKWVDDAAVHCHRCDTVLFAQGRPLLREHVDDQRQRPVMCVQCQQRDYDESGGEI